MKKILAVASSLLLAAACSTYRELPGVPSSPAWKSQAIAPSPQQTGGDAAAGFDYLINGDYIGTGLPYALLQRRMKEPDTLLRRQGMNANVPYAVTVFEAANGVQVMNGNCLTCHASSFRGEMVIGLGNSFSDYRSSLKGMATGVNMGMRLNYKKSSPEYAAFGDFGRYLKAIAPHIETNQPGVNPASRLAEACMAQRDPVDLKYRKEPFFALDDFNIASDVPPLWNVKKKNALYYNAIGRGDFTKLLFQASVLGISDSTAARQAIDRFKDVLAWLHTLEPPQYPGVVDATLAAEGRTVFEAQCSKCHGTYGEQWTYPNKVVSLDVVKTDPLYAGYASKSGIVEWYNSSWFAQSEPRSWFEPMPGYIAPPLDGIWATAPYLHNGSVPTLADLLDSQRRPTYWTRTGDGRDYDLEEMGWRYRRAKNGRGKWTYDTTLPGYSNEGHYFGDKLGDDERKAVLEYLKTL